MKSLTAKVDPREAALVVIDVQNDFCHEDGAFAKNGTDAGPKQAIVPALKELIRVARSVGTPVVFVRTTHSPETDSPAWSERHSEGPHYVCADGSWGAEWFQVAPEPDEPVVVKHRNSGFVGTQLDELLRAIGVKSVLITGVATHACVESTAHDAFMRDYFVVVVDDCTAASPATTHKEALDRISRSFGVVASSSEIINLWRPTISVASDR